MMVMMKTVELVGLASWRLGNRYTDLVLGLAFQFCLFLSPPHHIQFSHESADETLEIIGSSIINSNRPNVEKFYL